MITTKLKRDEGTITLRGEGWGEIYTFTHSYTYVHTQVHIHRPCLRVRRDGRRAWMLSASHQSNQRSRICSVTTAEPTSDMTNVLTQSFDTCAQLLEGGEEESLWPLIRDRTCCVGETISVAYKRHMNMLYCSLYLTKPKSLGTTSVCLMHACTRSLRPFSPCVCLYLSVSHTHTHTHTAVRTLAD